MPAPRQRRRSRHRFQRADYHPLGGKIRQRIPRRLPPELAPDLTPGLRLVG
jgi:hypothetical protein